PLPGARLSADRRAAAPQLRRRPGRPDLRARSPVGTASRQNPVLMPGSPPRTLAAQAAIAALIMITACGGASTALPIQTRPPPVARPAAGTPPRIAVIVMENE